MNDNRRLQERKLPERIVLCKLGGEESSFVLNLSEDGLGFESHSPIEKTGVLELRLSAGVSGELETTGRLAWLDSSKRNGGLRFLELSAPAREQIRAWLSETSAPSMETNAGASLQKHDKQAVDRALPGKPAFDTPASDKPAPAKLPLASPLTDKPVLWREMGVSSMQLVPIERHRVQKRRQFLAGVFVGFAICALLMIAFFWYAGGTKPSSLPWTTVSANHTAQSSAQQTQVSPSGQRTQASMVQSVSPGTSLSKLAAMQPASAAMPTRLPRGQKQNPQSAGASSTNLLTSTSSPSATPQPAKPGEHVASSRPRTKPSTNELPVGGTQETVARASAASNAHSSSGSVEGPLEHQAEGPAESKAQHPKKAPATPEQLWAALREGNLKAAVALADLYARGEGVPVNCEQARVLLLAASEKHNREASKKLQELEKGGCPATTSTSEPNP